MADAKNLRELHRLLTPKRFLDAACASGASGAPSTLLRAICPNCRTGTSMRREADDQIFPARFSDADGTFVRVQTWRCSFCTRTTALLGIFERAGDIVTGSVRQLWPESPPRELPPEAPDPVRSLFREASVAENAGAMRGAAALYRASVEEIVRDRGVSNIDDLMNLGLDAEVVTDLHDARLTGNWSLHEGIEFAPEEIADLAFLIEDAVEILYVEPGLDERRVVLVRGFGEPDRPCERGRRIHPVVGEPVDLIGDLRA